MSTIAAVKRIYHAETPAEPRKSHDKKNPCDGYYHILDPEKMSNRSLRNHLCEPWYGCHRCREEKSVCPFGAEYLRREAAGEIAPLKLWEARAT